MYGMKKKPCSVMRRSKLDMGTFSLCVKEWLRARRGPEEIGHGIDARPVLESLQRVRGDYFGQYHTSRSEICKRRSLLAAARRMLGRLSYFRTQAGQDSGVTGDSADP